MLEMKLFFCIILILLASIKKCKWNSDFAHYVLQQYNDYSYDLGIFGWSLSVRNFLSTVLSGGLKVNCFVTP